jgi:hypothetical protein
MGWFADLFTGGRAASIAAGLPSPSPTAILSPWQAATLTRIAWSEIFDGETDIVDRTAAMQIPAIARARSILVGVMAGLPLRAYDENGQVADQPEWLYRTDGPVSPWHRMAWTIDDLMFHGWSLWAVQRDGDTVTDAARVPFEMWDVDPQTGEIRVDGKAPQASEVILIPGPFEGLIASGAVTIRGAAAIERAWVGRAQNPIPLIELHQLTDDELDDDEIDDMMASWSEARTSPTGSVGFTDNRVEVRIHGTVQTDLFETARNANVLDIARLTGIPAALLDGSMSTASLTYSTQQGKRSEFLDFSLGYWTAPIEARLSLDDVVPRGQRVRFDRTELTVNPNTPTATEVPD